MGPVSSLSWLRRSRAFGFVAYNAAATRLAVTNNRLARKKARAMCPQLRLDRFCMAAGNVANEMVHNVEMCSFADDGGSEARNTLLQIPQRLLIVHRSARQRNHVNT